MANNCPDYPVHCRAGSATQRRLTPGEQAQITGRAAEFAAQAEVCSYCSLVFVRDHQRGAARRLGRLKGRFEPFGAYRG